MNSFLRSELFDTWLLGLKDRVGKARILHQIHAAEFGNYGDKSTQVRDIKRAVAMARDLDKEQS